MAQAISPKIAFLYGLPLRMDATVSGDKCLQSAKSRDTHLEGEAQALGSFARLFFKRRIRHLREIHNALIVTENITHQLRITIKAEALNDQAVEMPHELSLIHI